MLVKPYFVFSLHQKVTSMAWAPWYLATPQYKLRKGSYFKVTFKKFVTFIPQLSHIYPIMIYYKMTAKYRAQIKTTFVDNATDQKKKVQFKTAKILLQ